MALFDTFDPVAVDAIAVPFLNAIVAVTEFAGCDRDDDDQLFEAGIVKALLCSVAGFVVHPHQDAEQQDAMLEEAFAFLRAQVTEMRGAL